MSSVLRQVWLKILARAGRRSFVATSGLGHPFVCHVGDFLGENPFYNRDAFRGELEMCAAWLRTGSEAVVFDVGANVGFWSTHLAQMAAVRSARIYAFEPVAPTFLKLVESVERLGLAEVVQPVAAAVLESARAVRLSYSVRNSLFAQVAENGLNTRVGDRLMISAGLALDEFSDSLGIVPTLIKIDVEGSEFNVLRGARRLLAREDRPAVMFEHNPVTLAEAGMARSALEQLLGGYTLHYVDDFEGQRRPFGEKLSSLAEIDWVANIFAVPSTPAADRRWAVACAEAQPRCVAVQRGPSLAGRAWMALRRRRRSEGR